MATAKAPIAPKIPAKPATPAKPLAPAKAAPAPPAKAAPKAPPAPKLTPVQQRLKQMQDAYNESKEAAKSGGDNRGTTLSPGVHICRLVEARLIPSDEKINVLFNFQCVEGEETGETGQIWHRIDDPEKMVYFNRDLIRLEVDIDQVDIMDIEGLLAALQNEAPAVRLKVKEKGEYTNCFIDKRVALDESGELVEVAEEAAEDETGEAVEGGVAEEGEEVTEEGGEEVTEESAETEGGDEEGEVVEEEQVEEWVPAVDDLCKFKHEGKTYKLKIKTVNLKKETVDFSFQGKKITKPFAELERVES